MAILKKGDLVSPDGNSLYCYLDYDEFVVWNGKEWSPSDITVNEIGYNAKPVDSIRATALMFKTAKYFGYKLTHEHVAEQLKNKTKENEV